LFTLKKNNKQTNKQKQNKKELFYKSNSKVLTCVQPITRKATIYTMNQSKQSQETEADAVKLVKTCDQLLNM